MTNPYLAEDGKPNVVLLSTLEYFGLTIEQFKSMSDGQIISLVKRFTIIYRIQSFLLLSIK